MDTPTETLENLEIHATTLNPGESAHAAHKHPEEEPMIVKEDTVEALVNGEFKRVGPGLPDFSGAEQAVQHQKRGKHAGYLPRPEMAHG